MSIFTALKSGLSAREAQRIKDALLAAKAIWERGDHEQALAAVRTTIASSPQRPDGYFMLGRYLMRLGQLDQAHDAFCAALDLSKDFPHILHSQVFVAVAKARIAFESGDRSFLPVPALPQTPPCVSVIICSIDEARFAKAVAQYHRLLEDVPHEIIGIHDAKSLCEGYNRGARKSRGDLLVFSHDDVEIVTPDFAPRLIASLQVNDVIGVVGSTYACGATWFGSGWPYLRGQFAMPVESGAGVHAYVFGLHDQLASQVQVMDGFFLAAKRSVAMAVPFDETTFNGWHLYDIDFTFSAHVKGFRVAVCNDQLMIHKSHGKFDETWNFYQERFLKKHEHDLTFSGKAVFNQDTGGPVQILVPSNDEWGVITKNLIAANYPPGSIKARSQD
jgi:hypothetical protein